MYCDNTVLRDNGKQETQDILHAFQTNCLTISIHSRLEIIRLATMHKYARLCSESRVRVPASFRTDVDICSAGAAAAAATRACVRLHSCEYVSLRQARVANTSPSLLLFLLHCIAPAWLLNAPAPLYDLRSVLATFYNFIIH